jgi:hypothetical protein
MTEEIISEATEDNPTQSQQADTSQEQLADETVRPSQEELEAQMSDEEKKLAELMVEVATIANRLIIGDSRYGRLVASMLASRQLYAMCLHELERLCDDTNFKKATRLEGEPNLKGVKAELEADQLTMLKEILVNSAAVQAQQPFQETALFKGMVETVFPWMQEVCKVHTAKEHEQKREEFLASEKVRAELPVAFNVQLFPQTEKDTGFWIGKKKPLLFVGERKALRWLVDFILVNSVKEGNNVKQVIRLNSGGKPRHNDDVRLLNVARDDWAGAASSNGSFKRQFEQQLLSQIIAPVDLLIVDDLIHASGETNSLFPVTSVANTAVSKLRRWTEASNSLLISCLPLDRELMPDELNTAPYETLRMHNVLRSVTVTDIQVDAAPWCKVTVGQYEVARFPIEELNAYTESKIIKP